MGGSRKCCQRGSNFDGFFLVWWGEDRSKYHYKRAIIGLPAKHHLNGVSLMCRWWPKIECWFGSFVIFRGSRPVLLRNPVFLWFFKGGPDPLSPPSRSAHDLCGLLVYQAFKPLAIPKWWLVVILTLCMLGYFSCFCCHQPIFSSKNSFRNTVRVNPDQDRHLV